MWVQEIQGSGEPMGLRGHTGEAPRSLGLRKIQEMGECPAFWDLALGIQRNWNW